MVMAKGRREAHLHEMRIRATCVKQLVGKAGYKRVTSDALRMSGKSVRAHESHVLVLR